MHVGVYALPRELERGVCMFTVLRAPEPICKSLLHINVPPGHFSEHTLHTTVEPNGRADRPTATDELLTVPAASFSVTDSESSLRPSKLMHVLREVCRSTEESSLRQHSAAMQTNT
jgi:hypothetical protein